MNATADKKNLSWLKYGVNQCYKIPVLGYGLRILTAILNMPHIMRNINTLQASTDERLAEMNSRLTEAVARLAEKEDRRVEDAHAFDALYMSFEDRFRGTRAAIERKLGIYIACIKKLELKKEELCLLDIGCGRGEWLEMLRAEGYRAKGIDLNRVALEECRQRGLDVVEADAVEYLRGLKRNSLDVITGFHVIEHLPFPVMAALFDEAFAVLKSGGMMILETPNPTNLLVSAYDFYRDPGHIRPLHPDTVNFIAENRGFVRTGSYFVSNAGPDVTLIKSTEWKLDDIFDYVQSPRDYALIGYKP